jgi:hypothetical protein
MRGEYEEEEEDDDSWHGARKHGWETTAFGKANDGTGTEPEGESKGFIGKEGAGSRQVRLGWDAIQAGIGWSRRDRGGNGKETREGSSTPDPETSAVRPLWQHKTEEKEGGGEGTRATTDKGAGKRKCGVTKDVRGQAGQEGVPRNGMAASEVAENSEVKSTDAEVGEATYPVESVHGAERNTEGVQGQAGQDSAGRGMATPRASEDTDAEVGVTVGEGRGTEHALRPAAGQGTSMHPEERQRVPDDDDRVKPLRGKRGMKDGTTRHQDRRHGPSTIGMSGEWCLRKRRRRVENGGTRTGKEKCGVSKDMQGQSGPEGVPRDITTASEDAEESETEITDAGVGGATYPFGRVRGTERNTKRVMGSSKDRSTSARSKDNGEPTESKR